MSDGAGKQEQPWCAKVKTRNFKWDIQCYSSTITCLLLLLSMPVAQYHVCCYSSTSLSNNTVTAASPINARGTIPGLLLFHYRPAGNIMFAAFLYRPKVWQNVCHYSGTSLWHSIMFGAILVQDCGTLPCLLLLQHKPMAQYFPCAHPNDANHWRSTHLTSLFALLFINSPRPHRHS
jgi:hypothetical protein